MRLPHRMLRVVVSFIEWILVATANDIDVSFIADMFTLAFPLTIIPAVTARYNIQAV